jgi:hypothetical protein
MASDAYYSELIRLMRQQGAKFNPTTLLLGIMQGSDSVKIGDLVLDKEDIMIADYLLKDYAYELDTPYVSAVNFTADTATTQNRVVRKAGLKKGDVVAVMKLNHDDTYVILAKVSRL